MRASALAPPELAVALAPCTLGWVLVASSDRGIRWIALGDGPDRLLSELGDCRPAGGVEATPAAGPLSAPRIAGPLSAAPLPYGLLAQVVALIDDPGREHDLPLDMRGSPFQLAVWRRLQAIPSGRTASYEEVADGIDARTAVRAVAGACSSNPLAVAVPCHRVVRKDGGLSGYRWGLARKRALLAREARAAAGAGA